MDEAQKQAEKQRLQAEIWRCAGEAEALPPGDPRRAQLLQQGEQLIAQLAALG